MVRQAFGTHMVYRETFLQIQQRLLQHLIRRSWIHETRRYQNTHHNLWWVRTKHWCRIRDASPDSQPRIQSSLVREILQIIMEQTNNDCTSQIFISTNSPRQQLLLVGSQFLTEAMLWIKEVELVDSVDDLKSSCSVRGIRMPDFEVLDAKIASALNRIIHNTQFKRKVSLEEQKAQKEDRFLRGRQIPSRIMPTYILLFLETMMIFRNSIRNGTECYCQWRKSHLMISWKDCTN